MSIATTLGKLRRGSPKPHRQRGAHSKPGRPKGPGRAAAGLALTALLASGAAGIISSPASADTTGWQRYQGTTTGGGSYFGNYINSQGDTAVCALQGAKYGPGHPSGGAQTSGTYSDPFEVSSLTDVTTYTGQSRPDVTGAAAQQIAYIVSKWGGTEGVAADFALLRKGGTELSWMAAEVGSGVVNRANQMIAEAEANYGPYSIPNPIVTKTMSTGTVTNAGILIGGSGANLSGFNITYEIVSGNAVFDASGTTSFSVPSGSQAPLGYTVSASGAVQVRAWAQVPGGLMLQTPVGGGSQAQAILLAGQTRTVEAFGDPIDFQLAFQPGGTSTAASRVVKDGEPLIDTLHAAAVTGSWIIANGEYVPVPYTVSWYRHDTPQAQQATVPADAVFVGSEQVIATGPGDYTSAGTVLADGTATYTGVFSMTKAGVAPEFQQYISGDWSAPYFEPNESTTVQHEPDATSVLDVLTNLVLPGDEVRDVITTTAFPEDQGAFAGLPGFTADGALLYHYAAGPFEEWPTEGGPIPDVFDGTGQTPVATSPAVNGVEEISFTAPTTTGKYVVVTHFPGDARSAAFTTSLYDEQERFEVAANPAAVTQAQPQAVPGAPFIDTADVTDPSDVIVDSVTKGTWEWSIRYETFFAGDVAPLEVDENGIVVGEITPEIREICDGEPFTTSRTTITGAGGWTSEATTYPLPGNAFWVEHLERRPVVTEGQDEVEWETVTSGICGLPNETTEIVPSPTVVTKATEAVLVGQSAEDTATVTDEHSALAVPGYRWFIQFNTWGPTQVAPLELDADGKPILIEKPVLDADGQPVLDADGEPMVEYGVSAEIEGAVSGTPFFTSEQIAVANVGDYLSGKSPVVPSAGNLFWVEDLYAQPIDENGNDVGEPVLQHEGTPGLPNETTKAYTVPTVVTQATPEVPFGGQAEDTATVTDPDGAIDSGYWTFDIQFNAYGPQNAKETPVCDGIPFFTSKLVTVTATGQYKSGLTPAINKAGNLYWVEDLGATPTGKDASVKIERSIVHEGECGIPNETTKVLASPKTPGLANTGAGIAGAAGLGALLLAGGGAALLARKKGGTNA